MELRLSVLLVLVAVSRVVNGLTIDVFISNGTNLAQYNNDNSGLEERSYNLPQSKETSVTGRLLIPSDPDPCVHIAAVHPNTTIAFIDETYHLCPDLLEKNLLNASYIGMLVYTKFRGLALDANTGLPQAMFSDRDFGIVLETLLASNATKNEIFVSIWDDSAAKLQELFLIFAGVLIGAIILAILIACFGVCCKWCIHKWRTRGLTRWRIRQIPRRKYRKAKETTESCSICLEDFKEGCTIRVLPCSHVFHPKCVDEWLMKWNRTCPLCKATINRNKGAANIDPDETSQLISEEGQSSVRASFNESSSNYGATGDDLEFSVDSPPSIRLLSPNSPTSRDHHFMTPSEGEPLSFQTADELQSSNPIEPLVQ